MLAELYQYALNEKLLVKPGFKEKSIKYYISFDANGQFIGFEKIESKSILCPDIGSLANGTTKSNILAEKIYIILDIPKKDGKKATEKSNFYYDTLSQAAEYDELFRKALDALKNNKETIIETLEKNKIKPEDTASIKFDNKPLESSNDYLIWWEEFRKQISPKKSKELFPDFITGELCEPLNTTGKFKGLGNVGGHSSGDSLICFDKTAFQSYNLKQAANATVGEYSMAAICLALEKLLEKSKSLAGAKNIHWFKESTENDIFELLDNEFSFGIDGKFVIEGNNENKKNTEEDEHRIKLLFESVKYTNIPPNEIKNRYYIMSLSGVNGRVMVRNYDEGSYEELYKNIRIWYEDLRIVDKKYGEKYPKLFALYVRMLKSVGDKPYEQVDNELSGISNHIIYSILHNTTLPDSAAAKVLQYIRSNMYATLSDENKKFINIDRTACQFLKAWLNRRYRAEKKEDMIIMDTLNEKSTSVAYNVGRLMAVYSEIQRLALGEVNASVVERYYTSCCTSPALVIGRLATLSQYHLSKLDNPKKTHFSKQLEKISNLIGTSIPNTFNLEQQSQFALGFYFQKSEMRFKKTEDNSENETEE